MDNEVQKVDIETTNNYELTRRQASQLNTKGIHRQHNARLKGLRYKVQILEEELLAEGNADTRLDIRWRSSYIAQVSTNSGNEVTPYRSGFRWASHSREVLRRQHPLQQGGGGIELCPPLCKRVGFLIAGKVL